MENLTVKMRIKSTYRDLNPKEKANCRLYYR